MALVGVPDRGLDSHRAEDSDAAHAEDPLLAQAQVGAAGVELVHETAVVGMIDLDVGVEEIDRHPSDHHLPGPDVHRPARGLHRGEIAFLLAPGHRHERGEAGIELLVAVLLPSVEPKPLIEVALHVEEADADHRHAQVARGLAVVAGEHAEATRIDRHGVVQTELRAEVCDRTSVQLRVRVGEPGVPARGLMRHPRHHVVVPTQEVAVARAGGHARRIDPAEQLQRVVPGLMPERFVHRAEESRVPLGSSSTTGSWRVRRGLRCEREGTGFGYGGSSWP